MYKQMACVPVGIGKVRHWLASSSACRAVWHIIQPRFSIRLYQGSHPQGTGSKILVFPNHVDHLIGVGNKEVYTIKGRSSVLECVSCGTEVYLSQEWLLGAQSLKCFVEEIWCEASFEAPTPGFFTSLCSSAGSISR